MNLSQEAALLLVALRNASVLFRGETPQRPDGHRRWFTLAELAAEQRIGGDVLEQAALSRAARGLYRRHLVARRTMHTVTRWSITPDGHLAVAALEAELGIAELTGAMIDVEQAGLDVAMAQGREAEAVERLRKVRTVMAGRGDLTARVRSVLTGGE